MQVFSLFFENKVNGKNQKAESDKMIPIEFAHLKNFDADNHEDNKTHSFLNNFKLNQSERSSMHNRADSVCRNHERILKKRYAPTCQNNKNQWPILHNSHVTQL